MEQLVFVGTRDSYSRLRSHRTFDIDSVRIPLVCRDGCYRLAVLSVCGTPHNYAVRMASKENKNICKHRAQIRPSAQSGDDRLQRNLVVSACVRVHAHNQL